MSKDKKNETIELICEIEKNYGDNFKAQADFLKKITNKAISSQEPIKGLKEDSHKEPFTFILDFLGRNDDGRREIASSIMGGDWNKEEKILFLGIQNLTRAKFAHLRKEITENCETDTQDKNIQKCLKSIFCNDNNDCLKDNLDDEAVEKLKRIFDKPNSTVTSVLYWLYPKQFIPFDKNSKKLYKELGLIASDKCCENKDSWDWKCYDKVIEELKTKTDDLFIEEEKFKPSMIIALSFASWLMENQVDNILTKFLEDNKNKPKNIILTGIPGTGKTHAVKKFVENKEYECEFVQFHPSYDYEDFIEGLKPIPSKDGQIEFKLVDGVFKKLCKRAFESKKNNENKIFVMIIDEINRANLSRVFGELLYCLEYRGEFVSTKMTTYIQGLVKEEDKKLYSVDEENIGKFAIPENVIILGTMNEVDRSIDAFDLALRRRFIWEEVGFNETALRLYESFFTNKFQSHIEELVKKAKDLNKKLSKEIGANYQLGHTYYFKIIDYFNGDFESALCDLWDYHLKSIVREYCKVKFGEDELNEKLKTYKEIIVGKKDCNG